MDARAEERETQINLYNRIFKAVWIKGELALHPPTMSRAEMMLRDAERSI